MKPGRFCLRAIDALKKLQGANDPETKLALRRHVTLYEKWNKPEGAAVYGGKIAITWAYHS
jgi:hypothetical protein